MASHTAMHVSVAIRPPELRGCGGRQARGGRSLAPRRIECDKYVFQRPCTMARFESALTGLSSALQGMRHADFEESLRKAGVLDAQVVVALAWDGAADFVGRVMDEVSEKVSMITLEIFGRFLDITARLAA